ncbi:MAG: SURF1 family protein [Alphaproteobacteria bacterium]|nr:MAG: SURF1 family protein [Alphaproteobacteria bacterium]
MRRLIFLALIGIGGFALLIGLGVWQLQRLEWKRGILNEIAARMDTTLPALPEAPEEARDEYRQLRLQGVIGPGELHVLTSGPQGPGFRIIAPLELPDGRRVLLDRGYVPERDKDRPRLTGPVEVTGNLLWPDDVTDYTPAPDRARNIWFSRAVGPMAAALDTEPVLVVARGPTDPGITPMPVSPGIRNDHLQYAITWFALAAGWAGMSLLFWQRSRRRGAAKALESPARPD